MQDGIEREPEARAAYSFRTDHEVAEVGHVQHPTIKGSRASPDGLVGADGLVEIKCPQPAAHLELLLGGEIPNKYVLQVQWQMRCTDRAWCDFVSYSPVYPEAMRLHVRRIERSDTMITELEANVVEFLGELDQKLGALAVRFPTKKTEDEKTKKSEDLPGRRRRARSSGGAGAAKAGPRRKNGKGRTAGGAKRKRRLGPGAAAGLYRVRVGSTLRANGGTGIVETDEPAGNPR
jgi:hypothetical protein